APSRPHCCSDPLQSAGDVPLAPAAAQAPKGDTQPRHRHFPGEGMVILSPVQEQQYTSSVRYDSEKHFIDNVYMPVGLSISSCSQTVVCVPNCTWRSYKAEIRFEPRNKPQRFTSTTIIYPKHAKTVYTTTLDYNCRKSTRRFLSSVELETSECLGNDSVLDGC
ncbi:Protein FAM101B, partial [Cuculus canorus]